MEGLEEVVVLAFAANRLARAVSTDQITAPLRDRMTAWAGPGETWRKGVVDLIHCPVCTGWWTSLGISLLSPGSRRVRRGLAVAGVQVLLTLAERLVSEEGRVAVGRAERIAP
jgi:hypothetical protein